MNGELEITPAEVKVTITGKSESKVYNGEDQSVTGYTIEITEDASGLYTTDKITGLAQGEAIATGKNVDTYDMNLVAGTYTAENPSEQFSNTDSNFDVTIVVVNGELEITPAEVKVTIKGHKDSKVYNGGEQKVEGYDVEISDALYTEDDFTFSGEAVAKGTDVNTYPMNLAKDQFTNTNDNFDVTFEVTDGSLEITPVDEVAVTIIGHHNTAAYDGKEHSVNGYDAEISNSLYTEADFTFSGSAEAKRTDAGTTYMGLAEGQFENTNPNFAKVIFTVTDGYQTIDPINVTVTITGRNNTTEYDGEEHSVSGYEAAISNPLYKEADFTFSGTAEAKRTDAGTTNMGLAKDQFSNKNDNFVVTFEVTDGYQAITPVDEEVTVTITGHNDTTVYDGKEHSVSGYDTAISNPLYKTADFTFSGSAEAKRTDAGTTDMGLAEDQFANTNPNFAKITFNVTDGYQTINPVIVTVTITANSDEKVYNGEEQKLEGYTVEISDPLYTEDDFSFSGEAIAAGTNAGIYPMGLTASQFMNENPNFSVTFTVTDNALEIKAKELTITADSGEKEYDGTPLTVETFTSDGLAEGDTITALTVTGSQTEVGESENVPDEATIVNAAGEDVTDSYRITYVNGILTVTEAAAPVQFRLTVRYWIDAVNGTRAADTFTALYDEGAQYNVTSPVLNGYTANIARATGTITEDTTLDVVYTANVYELTIRYVYEDGRQAAETYREMLRFGENYWQQSPDIAGYLLSEGNRVISGTMPARNLAYTVTYRTALTELPLYDTPLGLPNLSLSTGEVYE